MLPSAHGLLSQLRRGKPATPGWDDWSGFVELTIHSGTVAADLTRFPLYVDLSTLPAEFWSAVRADGGDIRATTSDATEELPTDLVSIDTLAEAGELHVLVPEVSASADTTIRVYYGNAEATRPAHTSQNGRNQVWSDYRGVWHLQDDPTGVIVDSTGRGNDGTGVGTAPGDLVPGALAGSGLSFAGASYVTIPDAASLDITQELTLQAWARIDSPSGDVNHFLIDKTNGTGSNGQYLFQYDNRTAQGSPGRMRAFNGSSSAAIGNPPTDWLGAQAALSSWTHLTFVQVQNQRTLYGNGAQRAQESLVTNYGGAIGNSLPLTFGRRANTSGFELQGALDEIRIAARALTPAQVSAEHANQSAPSSFYTVGSVVTP